MGGLRDLIEFAKQNQIKIGTIASLIEYRSHNEKLVERVAQRSVQTAYGQFDLFTYVDKTTQRVHLALRKGEVCSGAETLVRVHAAVGDGFSGTG